MKLNRNDIILTATVLLVAVVVFLIFYFNQDIGQQVKISVDGEVKYSYSLNEGLDKEIKTPQGVNTVTIKNGLVKISRADCPDKICQKHRAIGKSGETIVCLPHKLVVEIE